jgi:hypothetical protein
MKIDCFADLYNQNDISIIIGAAADKAIPHG